VTNHVGVETEIIHFTDDVCVVNIAPVCCTLTVFGMVTTTLSRLCHKILDSEGCVNATVDGIQSSVCQCVTDLCNDDIIPSGGAVDADTTQGLTTGRTTLLASSSGTT
jgi:hypothetical protein